MILLFLLISSIISTTLMTVFSYGLAGMLKEQFREPELLNMLAIRLHLLRTTSAKNHPLGWIIHYAVGLLFICLIEWIRSLLHANVSALYYIVCGAVCGLTGIAIWFFTFKVHPNPPKLDVKAFYIQLFFAHIVFGLGAWTTAQLWQSFSI